MCIKNRDRAAFCGHGPATLRAAGNFAKQRGLEGRAAKLPEPARIEKIHPGQAGDIKALRGLPGIVRGKGWMRGRVNTPRGIEADVPMAWLRER